jgi:putative membrane protein
MTVHRMAAIAGLAVGLVTASLGIAATAGTATAGASTRAPDAGLAASSSSRSVSSQDRTFMDQASQINLTEISLGTYMHAHAATTTAKRLGATYAHDHIGAQASLKKLALRLHVTLPATPGGHNQSIVARIESEKGTNADVAFAKASVSGHKAAIATFLKEESAGSNAAVKAYAAEYLPMLRAHLRLAEHAESVIMATPSR